MTKNMKKKPKKKGENKKLKQLRELKALKEKEFEEKKESIKAEEERKKSILREMRNYLTKEPDYYGFSLEEKKNFRCFSNRHKRFRKRI